MSTPEPDRAVAKPAASAETATLPADLGARLRRLPGWMVVGGLTATLVVFAIAGMTLAGTTAGGPAGSPGSAASPTPGASASVGGTVRVEVANVGVDVPPGWTSTTKEPTDINLQNIDLLTAVNVVAFEVVEGQSVDDVVTTMRAGAIAPARVCRDEAAAMPNSSAPGRRLHICSPTQGGHDTVEAVLVAVTGSYALVVQVQGGGPIPIEEQLPVVERDILPTIRWKVGESGSGVTPSPTPSTTPGDTSFCSPVTAGTWTPQTLLGKSFEVAAVPIPNVATNLFEAGRIRLVNVLGDPGGYTDIEQADAVAIAAFTQYDAAVLRQLVVSHEGRFYAFEGRAHVTSTEGTYDPPPCRIPETDGRLERWRGGRFLVSADVTYSGWVYYVWTTTVQNYCATDTIRQYYPAIPQCA
jgi:hypothetical protein